MLRTCSSVPGNMPIISNVLKSTQSESLNCASKHTREKHVIFYYKIKSIDLEVFLTKKFLTSLQQFE